MPSGTPRTTQKRIDRITTSRAVRAPQITRERTSKNNRSVPNGCPWLGGATFGNSTPWAEDWAKPYGASHGAKIAQTTKTAVIATPATSIQRARPVVAVNGLPSADSRRRLIAAPAALSGGVERGRRTSWGDPSVPRSGVDERVDDVDQHADHHDSDREERDDAFAGAVVTRVDVEHQLLPEAGPVERRLGQDGT